jgi:nanoRNase/pAp phosphatase (c-di-AMP/oligoRNAs hydrolase)
MIYNSPRHTLSSEVRDRDQRLELLSRALSGIRQLLILPHNDPDPDAIASAVALRHLLASTLDIESRIIYQGIVGRAENKALVHYLGRPLRRLTGADMRASIPLALVDTQPGAGNHPLTPGAGVTLVFDHHPWREATARATFADVRPATGSTSTILTEYLQAADIEPPPDLATALFYGIKTDTAGLGRGAGKDDVAAYFYLQPRIDVDALAEIERAQVPIEYYRRLDAALHATQIFGDVLSSYVGLMTRPDLAAEIADFLLRLKGTQWVLCLGHYDDNLILAVRTRVPRGGAGHLVQEIVGAMGTAGGHGSMASGQIPLRGQDPELMAGQLVQRALEHLRTPSQTTGRLLTD